MRFSVRCEIGRFDPDTQKALATLPPHEQELLMREFCWDETQEQIAAAMGYSQQRVSQIRTAAIAKLRAQTHEN